VDSPDTTPVRLSVIVPVHNGAGVLDRCLDALARSDFRDYECIVVDDGSTDDTARCVASTHGAALVRLDARGGPARARNRGAARARGELLLFLDADVCVHPDTLSQVDIHFRQHPSTAAVIGSYDDRPADPGFISQYKNLFHHYVHQTSRTEAWTFWAGCGAIRRQAFARVHGFDESYTRPCVEDIDLGFRLRATGFRIDLNRLIQVTHLKRWTLWNLIRTDLLDRGVPWFQLMLRSRTMPPDLNVAVAHRVSVVLVFAMAIFGCGSIAARVMGARSPLPMVATLGLFAFAAMLLVLNYDLYDFFARKRGLLFALGAIPLHWLYYGYCGVAVGLGLSVHLWRRGVLHDAASSSWRV
jgi:GT2 family glycosyltransferase